MTVKIKDVFVITEREGLEKPIWSKIGVAFVNRDDSLSVVLDAVPLTGKMHIRAQTPKPTQQSGGYK